MSGGGLIAVLAVFVVLRLALHLFAPPVDDEAYYWLWGQHPALAYYDHPGLNAWLLGLASVLGWNTLALRLFPLLTTLATLAIFAWWARRLAGPDWRGYLLAAAAIWLASPIMFSFAGLAFPDHLLIFLGLAAIHLFVLFFEGYEEADGAGRPRPWLLYGAMAALGLAGLAKYTAVLIALAVVAVIVMRPRLRRLLTSPHLYLAALLCLAIQTPTLAWNLAHGFPGFQFHFARLGGAFGDGSLPGAARFLIGAAVSLSPALIPALIALLRSPPRDPAAAILRTLALTLFCLSSAVFFYESLRVTVFNYWNILAYVALFPLMPLYLKRPFFLPHLVYGAAFAAMYLANYAVAPIAPLASGGDIESAAVFGWREVAQRVATEQTRRGAGFVAGTYYQTSAKLGFALHDADVACIGTVTCHQFDLWRDPSRAGRSAIVLDLDEAPLPPGVTESFDRLDLIGTIPIERLGRTIATYRLYLGAGYHPPH